MPTTTSRDFTFGIEEEFFLTNPATRHLVTRVPKLFVKSCRRRLGEVVGPELLQSQIEISSPVFESCAQARAEMLRLRRGISDVASAMGFRLLAAGTHPLAVWHEQVHTDKPRYARLRDDFQIVAQRNLLCGLHVHVGIPEGVDRVILMNRLMPWLPAFLALSTSSPFWDRQNTGLLSYRQAAYDEWPRSGVPDFFHDESEYNAFAQLLIRAGAIRDASFLWWSIRPSQRCPTLELRVPDCCTRLDDAVAIATLFRCLVRAYVRRPELGHGRTSFTRRLIDENCWRAKRAGLDAEFIDERSGTVTPFSRLLVELRALVADDARDLGAEDTLEHLDTIMASGTSAHRQLQIYGDERAAGAGHLEALHSVVDWLLDATVSGQVARAAGVPASPAHPPVSESPPAMGG